MKAQTSDDAIVLSACLTGNQHAWETLEERLELLMFTGACFVIDERRNGTMEEARGCYDAVLRQLKRDPTPLRGWKPAGSRPRTFLPLAIRPLVVSYLQDVTPPATLLASLPAGALLPDAPTPTEPASQAMEAVERLPPLPQAVMRLRLWGFELPEAAAALGVTTAAAKSALDGVAGALAETGGSRDLWRVAMRVATPEEVVARYLEDEEDEALLEELLGADQTWRTLRARARRVPKPKLANCFDDLTTAGFVDGTLKGAARARAESHLTNCPRCVDGVARLTELLNGATVFRDLGQKGAVEVDPHAAAAAASLSVGRYRAAWALSERAADSPRARDLGRLARVGLALDSGDEPPLETGEPSGVLRTIVPTDHEAPIIAIEALASGDAYGASRAIDDEVARTLLGSRLRLLASAAGHDLELAHRLVDDLEATARRDPMIEQDVRMAASLPEDRALPRALLLERVETLLPSAARLTLAR